MVVFLRNYREIFCAGGLFIFLGRVKGYPCGDTGVLYVILIGTVGMLGVDENLSRRR